MIRHIVEPGVSYQLKYSRPEHGWQSSMKSVSSAFIIFCTVILALNAVTGTQCSASFSDVSALHTSGYLQSYSSLQHQQVSLPSPAMESYAGYSISRSAMTGEKGSFASLSTLSLRDTGRSAPPLITDSLGSVYVPSAGASGDSVVGELLNRGVCPVTAGALAGSVMDDSSGLCVLLLNSGGVVGFTGGQLSGYFPC
jgi:hypothetical protein